MGEVIYPEEIRTSLKNIFKARFNIDIDSFDASIFDKHLLGRELYLAPRDLLYLFFDIEKNFNIKIPQEDIVLGRFSTFNNLYKIIVKQLEINKCEAG